MLEEITITDLGIIKKTRLPFTPGLSVITGETGAGKTMVLSALQLLLGKRAKAGMARAGSTVASVEGCWLLEESPQRRKAEEAGAVIEDDQLFISRTVQADGKSRSVLGGKSTPAGVLADLGAGLVNIHGQADQLRLRSPQAQQDALDRFGGAPISTALKSYLKDYRAWRAAKERYTDLKTNASSRKREYEALRRFLTEVDTLDPQEDELDALEREITELSHMDDIFAALGEAHGALEQEDGEGVPPMVALEYAAKALTKVVDVSTRAAAVHTRLDALLDELADLTSEVQSALEEVDGDSISQLHLAQDRELELKTLVKKYGTSLEDVLTQATEGRLRLEELDPEANSLEVIELELASAEKKLHSSGGSLTAARRKAADKLTQAVNKELAGLAMSGSSLVIELTEAPPTASGTDTVQLLLTTPGSGAPRPIATAASGGELSRIMLALEVVLADPKSTPTFVFDEVDSGVGGATAIEIGKRLARLAREAQVIVVTHLPQVAVYADNHLKVEKAADESYTETSVRALDSGERVTEIARMLAGMEESATGLAHAEELLAEASSFKQA